jgi:hypothetical protein
LERVSLATRSSPLTFEKRDVAGKRETFCMAYPSLSISDFYHRMIEPQSRSFDLTANLEKQIAAV